ncbi:hypothetical protein HaLaN_00103 [Haematococcus lacustris]|uniref:Uncharacterized protein n=1 Tax=Haematococcus lacustris TaxID=44745 RepID=A0A699Y8L1_HAELA|nr:hypothetical protein HaLaN_00103 [Haematococcus lacustris]
MDSSWLQGSTAAPPSLAKQCIQAWAQHDRATQQVIARKLPDTTSAFPARHAPGAARTSAAARQGTPAHPPPCYPRAVGAAIEGGCDDGCTS